MEAVFCIHIEWQNQPMVFLLTLQIFCSFLKFIRKYLKHTIQLYDQNITFPLFVLFQILQLVEF